MTKEERNEYMNFMYNPANSHKCENCPENGNFDNWQNKKPCGQWRCWVDVHCERMEENEYE